MTQGGIDLSLAADELAFQLEARRWLEMHAPREPMEHFDTKVGFEQHRDWERILFDGGWGVVGWPAEYGGRNATPVESLLFEEEYARAGAPVRVNQNGLAMLGPTLIAFGTEEQKSRHLRRLARGDDVWAQGWSEPNAGSDLASMRTRATPDGDDYVLDGQKIWVSRGGHADWMFTIARTDPATNNHRGLTFFLVSMASNGLTRRPIEEIDGRAGFAEIFMDGVRVPAANVVGTEGEGWKIAMATLGFERSAFLRPPGRFAAVAARLLRLARERTYEPALAAELAEVWALTEAYRLLNLWSVSNREDGDLSVVHANVNKLVWSEMDIRLQDLAVQLLGERAELWDGAPDAIEGGRWMQDYLFSLAGTIYAGTTEIQNNLIAERGLGLPRR
ncbi:MAG TPA: acyl-CoA dehydrogenase family protein [Clostridia bacterium]|nr:acyl-CoA dehydrogenase family protein [Clostridia bacterium]